MQKVKFLANNQHILPVRMQWNFIFKIQRHISIRCIYGIKIRQVEVAKNMMFVSFRTNYKECLIFGFKILFTAIYILANNQHILPVRMQWNFIFKIQRHISIRCIYGIKIRQVEVAKNMMFVSFRTNYKECLIFGFKILFTAIYIFGF